MEQVINASRDPTIKTLQSFKKNFVPVTVSYILSPSSSYLSDHFGRDGGLADSRLSPAFDPVDGGRFLVGAVVPTNSHHLQLWEVLLQCDQSLLCTLQTYHVLITVHEMDWDCTFSLLQCDNVHCSVKQLSSHYVTFLYVYIYNTLVQLPNDKV